MNKNQIKTKIKDYWIKTPDLFAEKYTNPFFTLVSPANAFLYARRKKVIKIIGNLSSKNILDVGCGSGIFMVDFAKKGATVVGVDYSQKMLDLAKTQLNTQKINPSKYKLVKAEATKLPFQKQAFDLILATGLADYLSKDQNEVFIKEAARVLKKDGKLICGFPVKESPVAFLRTGIGLWFRENFLKLPPIESNFSLLEIRKLFKNAGLKEIKHSKVFFTMWIIVAKHA